MNLTSTDSLQLITSAAQNTDVLVHWFDFNTSTKVLSGSRTRTNITTATTTTILAAPASGVERTVKVLSIRNRGASANTVTLVFNDGTNTTQPIKVTLQVDDSLHFNFNVWQVLDSSGQVKQVVTTIAAPHTHTLSDISDVTITNTNLNTLDDGANTTLHFHDSDRNRTNHTGTQLSTTISDFTEAAQDAVGAMVDASLTYVDGTPLLQRSALTGAVTASAGSNATALGSFTKSQLDTAVSDGNVQFVGDAPTAHTHTSADVTDFAEAVDDRVSSLIVAGTNITTTYNDGANTLTIDAANGDPWTYVKLGSDFTNNTTTRNNVTGLSFTPSANTTYEIHCKFLLQADTTTTGPRPGISWPGGTTETAAVVMAPSSATAATFRFWGDPTTQDSATTGVSVINETYLGTAEAYMVMGGSPSGSFQIVLASEVAASTVRMMAGSFIRYRTVP